MVSALLIGLALIAAEPELSREDRAAYKVAKDTAGRDPKAHVKLALWCEAHGLNAERTKHLAIALLTDPKNAIARGLLGLIEHDGHWQAPDVLSRALADDPAELARQAEYRVQRDRTPETADGQWKLALWCESNGLPDAAKAHLVKVVRLDPKREAAWKRLGYKLQGGRWASPEQIATEKQERELQKQADRQWKSHLEKWRGWLGDRGRRAHAERALATVTDPRAVPMIWAVFATRGSEHQQVAVQLLGQVEAPGASRALAILAVLSKSAEVRRTATESLLRRDAREFAGLLIGMLREPIKYEIKHVNGPGTAGELFIEGKQVDYKRRYTPLPVPQVTANDQFAGFDDFGLPVVSRSLGWYAPNIPMFGGSPVKPNLNQNKVASALEGRGMNASTSNQIGQALAAGVANWNSTFAPYVDQMGNVGVVNLPSSFGGGAHDIVSVPVSEKIPVGQQAIDAGRSAAVAEETLRSDVQAIESHNAPIAAMNSRLVAVLSRVAGQDFADDRESWEKWYADLLGYAIQAQQASQEKSTVVEDVPVGYTPQAAPVSIAAGPPVAFRRSHSCFAAGTRVRTLAGLVAIESIHPGDEVLSQNTKSGALTYKPVAAAYHNPPNNTLRIDVGDETIVATRIHRFWNVGKGWTMARDLKAGDVLRNVGGTATVKGVTQDRVQPVFNLELVDGDSFFVGEKGVLVHDNSVVRPVIEAFDAPVVLAGGTAK